MASRAGRVTVAALAGAPCLAVPDAAIMAAETDQSSQQQAPRPMAASSICPELISTP